MWNDEDNNPYGSFERPENGDDTTHQNVMNPAADQPYTTSYTREQQTSGYIASMESPESHVGRDQLSSRGGLPYRERSSSVTSSFDDRRLSRAHGNQSDEDDVEAFTRGGHLAEGPGFADDRDEDNRDDLEDIKVDEYGRPVGDLERIAGYGFQNRIQQLLIENPDLPILIVDAGKNVESGGSYIVYTIRTGDLEVRRRYSEFSSLRDILVQLHPTLIVPPIPSKHSMADYAAKPTRAKEDLSIIDLRKRMLQVFLNRCRNMPQIRDDGVWWRFLDPNANWNEVLHSPPASLLPKNLLKAPPINPWNPLPAHGWLPVPSANARLKGTASAASQLSGPGAGDAGALSSLPADVPVGGVSFQSPMAGEFLPRFPPSGRRLSESELDPYFVNYEHSTKELENLLNGSIEKVNRRTLAHLSVMSTDMMELGARLNAFSLSETSRSLASAIEQTGQAFDRCYILTSELNANLSATFAEPMRELAQFASVVRSVVRYRVLKRVQQEMTLDELSKKRAILQSLERSEMEASRINQYLTTRAGGGHGDQTIAAARRVSATHQRGASTPGVRPNAQTASSQYLSPLGQAPHQRENAYHQPPLSTAAAAASPQGNVATEDTSSIDSDFPPQTDKSSTPSWLANPSAEYSGSGLMSIPPPSPVPPQLQQQQPSHRKSSSMTGKLFGRISHAVHGFVDVDPEKTRRDQMGKTKEGLTQLEQALEVSGKDVKLASKGVLADLKRFQEDQEDDLRKYMVAYARCHLDWARKNLETWVDAKDEALKIDVRAAPHVGQLTVTTSSSKRQKSHHRDGHGHPVSGGNHGYHGHRRHRLHSRHHDSQQQQQQQQPHQGDLVEQSRSHTFSHSLATSSPSDLVEKQTRERAELGSDLSSTSTPTGTCERQRSREHTDRHRKGDHLKRWELRRLERKLLKPEVDSAKFLTPATIRRRLRLQNKKSLKWKIELKARRKDNNNRSEGVGREDIKEKSAEISSSEHRFRHGANSQSQPEASPASSLAASTVSTRKRTPTSLALEDRNCKEKDKRSAAKDSEGRSRPSKQHTLDRNKEESERKLTAKRRLLPSSISDSAKSVPVPHTPKASASRKRSSPSSKRPLSEFQHHSHRRHQSHLNQSDAHPRKSKQHKHRHTPFVNNQNAQSIDDSSDLATTSTLSNQSRGKSASCSPLIPIMSNNNSEAGPRPASPLFSRNDPESRINDEETAIDQEASHDSDSNGTESSILPSIDVQIQQVMNHVNRPISEGQKGYLVSCRWLNRVLARCSNKDYLAGKTLAKDVTEGEIGQIDNSDLLIDSPQLKGLKDIDGQDFVPIKPGLTIGVEFEVLPEDAWNLIQRWYGLKSGCPIIIREAHNTAADSDTMENIQYELRPPVFTAVKLSHTPASVPGNDRSPVMIVASRRTSFNALLKYLKQKSGILMSTKVRVWRVIGTDGASPTDSSAATSKTKIGTNMVLPVSTFTALETGSQRELLEAKDQTSNEKYNGKATLEQYGLGSEEELVVLEEQLGGKAWCADLTPAKAAHLTGSATPGIFMSQKDKNENVSNRGKDRTSSQRDAVANNGSCNIPASAKSSIRKEENERKRKERNGVRRRKDGKAVGVTGLVNLGNTCYMNSALQCIRSVEELTRYFLADRYKEDLNPSNPLGHDGNVARAYAHLLHQLFDVHASSAFSPRQFKNVIGRYGPSFSGYGQQDSQEFIMFLLDGLQEDLNRIQKKPYIEKPDSTDDMVNDKDKLIAFADEHWRIYKARNDSVITDLFAGMYKSTLHCPECDKVSIIFDPFHNLTLQLPVENTWSHRLTFFPLYGKPITMDIEIEKNSSVKALKAHVAKKLGLASDAVARLILSEVYRSRFYRMFDNKVTLADAQIDTNDEIAMYEVESAPTSYDADYHRANQGYRSLLFSSRRDEDAHLAGEFKSSKGDRILVPIYSRLLPPKNYNNYAKPALKGHPGYAIINREEAYDYDMILKKVLGFVACLTTRDILGEAEGDALKNRQSAAPTEHEESVETDDLVDIGDEMNDVNGVGNVRAESIKSEEGVVDVSMTDAPANDGIASQNVQDSPILRILRPGAFIPAALQNIFEMKYTQTNEACPTSIGNEAAEFRTISSRLPSSRSSSQASSSGRRDVLKRTSISSTSPTGTDDEFTSAPQLERTTTITQSEVEPDSESEKTMPVGDSAGAFSSTSNSRSSSVSRSRSASRSSLHHRGQSEVKKNRTGVPLVRPGEAIILDWTEEAYDALFGSKHASKGGLRGSPTWENPEVFDDPELKAKRLQRRRVRSQGISLEDCLDEFGREEILSENDAWYCPRCKTHRRASKKFELWRTPDILVMHLKRFSSNRIFRDKLDTLVDFPQELDMTDRVMYPELGKSQKYELIAVDNHYGGLGGGHYTAYARNFVDGNWYDYNDSSAHRVDPSKVITRSAYLLFYRRKSAKPLGGPHLEELVTRSRLENDSSSSDSESESEGDEASGTHVYSSRQGGVCLSGNGNGNAKNKIPDLDREKVVLPKTTPALPMIKSTASIGVPAKIQVKDGSEDSPLRAMQSTPTWSFPKLTPAPAAGDGDAGDGQENSGQMPGSFPNGGDDVAEGENWDSVDAEDSSYRHLFESSEMDEDSDEDMPVKELKAE